MMPTHVSRTLDEWFDLFEAAEPLQKANVAAGWLGSYDGNHLSQNEFVNLDQFVFLDERYLRVMREMVWSIPETHTLFLRRSEREVFHTGNWLRGLLGDQQGGEAIGLVRDMWLQRSLAYRKLALLYLAENSPQDLHPNYAALMRQVAWDIAKEDGLAGDTVAAATRLTLWSLHTILSRDYFGGHAILDALQLLCSELAPSNRRPHPYNSKLTVDDAKSLIVAHPCASVVFLQYMEQQGLNKACKILHGGSTQFDKFESLATWLPSMSSVTAALQSVGTTYEGVLNALVARGFAEQEVIPLPEGLASNMEH